MNRTIAVGVALGISLGLYSAWSSGAFEPFDIGRIMGNVIAATAIAWLIGFAISRVRRKP